MALWQSCGNGITAQLRLFRSPSLLIYTITGVRTHVAAGPLNGIPNLYTMLILKCLASKMLINMTEITWFYEQKEIALKWHIGSHKNKNSDF